MKNFYLSLYMVTLTVEALTLLVFGYFLSKYPKNRFRFFFFIVICIFILILFDFVLRFYFSAIFNHHPILFLVLTKACYVSYGLFMMFRFLFLHDLIHIKMKKTINFILFSICLTYIGIVISPFYIDFQTMTLKNGYYFNQILNYLLSLYVFITILIYRKKIKNPSVKRITTAWVLLIPFYLTFNIYNYFIKPNFPVPGEITENYIFPEPIYILGYLFFILFINTVFMVMLRKNFIVNPSFIKSNTDNNEELLRQKKNAILFQEQNITEREREIIKLILVGKSNREIGGELYISETTVKTHISHIFRKLEINNRVELIQNLRSNSNN